MYSALRIEMRLKRIYIIVIIIIIIIIINTDISQVLIDCITFLSSLHQHNENIRRSFTRTFKCRYSSQTPTKK